MVQKGCGKRMKTAKGSQMERRCFLGIDGGGTKTALLLCDAGGRKLAMSEIPTIHLKQVDAKTAAERLSSGLATVLQAASRVKEEIAGVAFGAPGYGEYPELLQAYPELLATLLPQTPSRQIVNDAVLGWAGSLALQPGINMVLGTGAIAYGRDAAGNEARSSGWGPIAGDEGSAFWLGQRALGLFAKECDGRSGGHILRDIFYQALGLTQDYDIFDYIGISEKLRNEVAPFATLLSQAAEAGDRGALQIFREAAQEAALAVRACYAKLHFAVEAAVPVSTSGGVFRSPYMRRFLREYLREARAPRKFVLQAAQFSPVEGAILLAYANAKLPCEELPLQELWGAKE